MAGNVFEWTLSRHHKYPYSPSCNDPEGDDSRVLRGGSWDFPAGFARCAYRYDYSPRDRLGYVGFRVAVSLANSVF